MNAPAARLRAELQASTGVDFADYADDEFADAVTGWSTLVAVAKELALAVALGAAVAVAAMVVAATPAIDGDPAIGLVIGGLIGGAGVAVLAFTIRIRRRLPAEAAKVFQVSAEMMNRVSDDLASGKLRIGVADAVRGVAIVAAIPALVTATRRRFPLVGAVVAPAVGSLISRALLRVWPTGRTSLPVDRLEAPARQLERALGAARDTVVPKLQRAVRWVTLPLLIGGGVVFTIGVAVVVTSGAVG